MWRTSPVSSFDLGTALVDLNGDGLPDIVKSISGGAGQTETSAWINTGYLWALNTRWIPPVRLVDHVFSDGVVDEGVRFVDLNGDGYVDVVAGERGIPGYNHLRAWLNTGPGWVGDDGSGWVEAPQWAPPVAIADRPGLGIGPDEGVRFADVNGDGLVDIVQNLSGGVGWVIQRAWLNTGSGWKEDDSWTTPVRMVDRVNVNTSVDEGVRFADLNGDGLVDIIQNEDGLGDL